MRLLLVEDDAPLCQALGRLLRQWGYAVELAADGPAALNWCEREPFDLVILDLGLPGCDGLEVCRTLRSARGPQPLILMLTAWDSSADRVTGLDEGADDYVVKPFDPDVLRARVRALLRRSSRPLTTELNWGSVRLTPGDTRLSLGDGELELTRKEALLLETLLRAAGRSCSKAELLEASAAGTRDVGEETIKAHMRNLRVKLAAAGAPPDLIETVYGIGYRLNPAHST
ncbi:response regulator transcription factor [Cyanobium sp. FGCU-6]|nr:response regulator transcription factor [Cyanobium sp. FGCU6]